MWFSRGFVGFYRVLKDFMGFSRFFLNRVCLAFPSLTKHLLAKRKTTSVQTGAPDRMPLRRST